MIERYTRKPMGMIWAEGRRFHYMKIVEVTVAKVQGKFKIIPNAAALAIARKSKYDLERIAELEKETKHDVIAFVTNMAEHVGPHGRFIHYGLTSSDVIDTALSLQIQESWAIIDDGLQKLLKTLKNLAIKNAGTLCAGRTHGMHAEVTSFGFKMAGFVSELRRHYDRIEVAAQDSMIGKLSGAVGTYSTSPSKVETEVCRLLKLEPESVATQVIPRDRHAALMTSFALLGGFIERLSVELRHLQRTEVSEVIEGFSKKQKGSSAMPHKKNPISAENLTGVARLLRSYASAALENQALWHERDISHSSVERVILPDSFILVDYAIHRLNDLLSGLEIDKARMRANIDLSQGRLFSSYVLLALVKKGPAREDAYKWVQECSHDLKPQDHLRHRLKKHPEIKRLLTGQEIDRIFSDKNFQDHFKILVTKAVGR